MPLAGANLQLPPKENLHRNRLQHWFALISCLSSQQETSSSVCRITSQKLSYYLHICTCLWISKQRPYGRELHRHGDSKSLSCLALSATLPLRLEWSSSPPGCLTSTQRQLLSLQAAGAKSSIRAGWQKPLVPTAEPSLAIKRQPHHHSHLIPPLWRRVLKL